MRSVQTQFDIGATQSSWQAFDTMAYLRPLHDEVSYVRMTALLDAAGDDKDHPLSGLLDLVSEMVENYEQEHHAIETSESRDALRILMEARGLKQEDLPAVVVQSNLSAILAEQKSAHFSGQIGQVLRR